MRSVREAAHWQQYGCRTGLTARHLGQHHLFGDLPALQIGLDLPAREVAVVDVLGQVDFEELEKPALIHGERVALAVQLGLQLTRRVKTFGCLTGGQMVQSSRQGEQIASRFGLADDLLRRGVAFRVHACLGRQPGLYATGLYPVPCRNRSA